jgi:hypothetical protein
VPDDPQPPDAAALVPEVYHELRRIAAAYMRRERAGMSLQPTALVHEAFLRLAGAGTPWNDTRHFLAIAARSMRQILVEHARARGAPRLGAGRLQPLGALVGDLRRGPGASATCTDHDARHGGRSRRPLGALAGRAGGRLSPGIKRLPVPGGPGCRACGRPGADLAPLRQ